MHYLTAKSDIHWHYELNGEGAPIVFFHGWGVDKRIWRQQTKYFAENYQVLAVDLPGHGKSTWEKVTLKEMCEDLHILMDTHKIRDSIIVGSSLGGLFSLKMYELNPHAFKKIVFVGSMPKFSKSIDFPHGLDIEKMKKLGSQLDSDYPNIVNVFFRSLFTKQERMSRRYKWMQRFRQDIEMPMKPALVQYLDMLEQEDLRDILKAVHLPVQFINGTGDEICTRAAVEDLKLMLPNAQFDDFEECGHFPFLSKPYEFNEILEKFLKVNHSK